MTSPYFALIPAAGSGSRMGAALPKQYLPLLGRTILQHTVGAFLASPLIQKTFLVVSADDTWIDALYPTCPENLEILRCGGASRAESVCNGLQAIAQQSEQSDSWVMVHDAARPGLTQDLIKHLISQVADDSVGGLLALPVVDTVKRSVAGQASAYVAQTVPRDGLWLAQTPQLFRLPLLLRAMQEQANNPEITDEASAIEALGFAPRMVLGHPCNLKITLEPDLAIAEMYLRAAQTAPSQNGKKHD